MTCLVPSLDVGRWTLNVGRFLLSSPLPFLPNERPRFHLRLRRTYRRSSYDFSYAIRRSTSSQLDRSNPGASRRKKCRLQPMPQRHRAHARCFARRPRLHRLPRRQSGPRPNERASACATAQQTILENLRQSAAFRHLAQPRIARVHPLHESGRSARGTTSVRSLPRCDHSQRRSQHDEPRRDALGRRSI